MPTRRDVLKSTVAAGAGLALGGAATFSSTASAQGGNPNGLNILMLILDDLNDWVGYLGRHPQATTPNLDQLAGNGVGFKNAFCVNPQCNPSRVATLTGLLPSTTGVFDNSNDGSGFWNLVQHFQQHGYRAVRSGKVFHWPYVYQGWDQVINSPAIHPAPPLNVPALGTEIVHPRDSAMDAGPNGLLDGDMRDFQRAQGIADFLSTAQQQPFLVCYGTSLPHLPWYVPQAHFDRFPVDEIELPFSLPDDLADVPPEAASFVTETGVHEQVLAADAWPALVQGYLAASHFADACMGQILDALESSPYRDNTIVVVWSDHGFHLGEKTAWGKLTLWDNSLRVPLIVHYPGMSNPGRRCDRVVSLLDLFPTLCGLTDTAAPQGLEGRSLLPLLEDPIASWSHPAYSIRRLTRMSVRTERWRYSRYQSAQGAPWQEELYHCSSDPHQLKNLAPNPFFDNVKAEHAQLLDDVTGDPQPPPPEELPCGKPLINVTSDDAAFLWRECGTGHWRLLVAGDSGNVVTHTGSVISDQPFSLFEEISVEAPWDVIDRSDPKRIDFTLLTAAWHDGFRFAFPPGASVRLELTSATPLRVGPDADAVTAPFQLT